MINMNKIFTDQNNNNNNIIVAATLAIIVSTIIISSMISPLTIPLQTSNTLAFALQQTTDNNKSTTTIADQNAISHLKLLNQSKTAVIEKAIESSSTGNKTFYLFSSENEGINETKLGIPGDTYNLHTMVVHKGDNVTVHFYNLEIDENERHSFTIGAPYKIDSDLAGNEHAVIKFKADHEGIFQYFCKYHPITMTGQLVIIP
jgi:nitrous oxide reductase